MEQAQILLLIVPKKSFTKGAHEFKTKYVAE